MEADPATYTIVVRDRTQFSVIPAGQPTPPGWEPTGQSGTLAECMAVIAAQVKAGAPRPAEAAPAPAADPPPLRPEQGLVVGPTPLTPAQHKFFTLDPPEPHHWNLISTLEISPAPDPRLLEQAVQLLIEHHDALRLRLAREPGGWRQWIAAPGGQTPFACCDLSELDDAEQSRAVEATAQGYQTSLNLAEGPLLRVVLFLFGAQRPAWLLLIINHLIADGLSLQILLADIHSVYQQLSRGEPPQLPPKTTSFKQWVERQVAHAQTDAVRAEADYWCEVARAPVPSLPADGSDSPLIETQAFTLETALDADHSRALLRDVLIPNQIQITDVLLAALAMTVARWRGPGATLIDFVQNGRVTVFKDVDLSRTVGWLSISYPLRMDLPEPHTPLDALATAIRQVRRVPNRGFGYELLCFLAGREDIAEQLRPILRPELMLNYIGQSKRTHIDAAWRPISVPVGLRGDLKNLSFLWLYCESAVVEDQLTIKWTFNTQLYRHETIARVAETYLACLCEIIDARVARLAAGRR